MSRLRGIFVGLLLAGPFYLLLIDTVSAPELYAGAGATIVAALVYAAASAEGFADASFATQWLLGSWRVLAGAPLQVLLLCREAVLQVIAPQPSRGRLRSTGFTAGSDDSARDRGRRALAEALGSLAPGTIVIGVDPESNLLLVHQLPVTGGRERLDQLGLG